MIRRILAAIGLCLIAGSAFAQEPTIRMIFKNTEQTDFKFRWAPATGPVYGYECCIDYLDFGRHCFGSMDLEHVFTPAQWHTWRIQVRAMDAFNGYGSWSDYSILFNINPDIADINYDGAIGMPDYSILMSEWGKTAEPLK